MRQVLPMLLSMTLCAGALADQTYTLHENLHVGQKVIYTINDSFTEKSTSTMGGVAKPTDTVEAHDWKVTLTILEQAQGSATHTQVQMSPDSVDYSRTTSLGPLAKTTCPFAGKTILLRRHADGTVTNNATDVSPGNDLSLINNLETPDQDMYPDKPVAVGDVWDNSVQGGKDAGIGPNDQYTSKCRLDWVKTIDGKQFAQITNSIAEVENEPGNVEEDITGTGTLLVDIAAGMVVKSEFTETSKYVTAAGEPTQVGGGTEYTFHCAVVPDTAATTRP